MRKHEILEKQISIAELVYLLYFTVMFGAKAVGLYEGLLIYNISLVVGMLLFLLKVVVTGHTVGEYLLMGVMLLLSLAVYYNTGEKGLLLYFTMMLGMKCVSMQRVLRLATYILATAFTALVLLSITGLIQDITYIHERTGFGRVIRHSLGYPYPNTLFTTYIVLMALLMLQLKKQTKKGLLLTTILMAIGAVYIYLYSCSNTGLIVAVFYLLMNLYLQLRPQLSKVEKIGILCVYPACMLLSIVGPLVTSGKLFQLLDRVLHNRWAYSYYYLTHEPITLFGIRFQPAPNENYMIDSSFLYSFLQIGVIPFLLVTALMLFMIWGYVRQQKKTELAIIASFCVLGLSDPFFFNLSYKNLLFLFVGDLFYKVLAQNRWMSGGILGKNIQLLKWGSKVIDHTAWKHRNAVWYYKIKDVLEKTRNTVFAYKGQIFILYMAVMLISIVLGFLFTYSGHVVGKIDQIEEWEYAREIVSIGVWGSLVPTLGYIIRMTQKYNASGKKSSRKEA